MTARPPFKVRLHALLAATRQSMGRARDQGLSPWQMAWAALKALAAGPRSFARRVIAYAQARESQAADASPLVTDSYRSWLSAESISRCSKDSHGLVSVVMPVCNTPEAFLREAYESLCAQDYADWELCVHDDGSDDPRVRAQLESLMRRDPRVRVSLGEQRGGIARASNAALALASGRWVAFLDHDDVLHPNALAECVAAAVRHDAALVYTDHDALSESHQRCLPYFKPDWSPDLFLSQMYLGHLVMIDRSLVARVGGLRPEMDGAQDYDLVLRCVDAGGSVAHVPRVLYHWRQHSGSTSANVDAKPYAHHAGRRALQEFVDRQAPGARVHDGEHAFCYDVRYPLPTATDGRPVATIIIPTRDRLDLLEVCIRTLMQSTSSPAYEIIIVDNGSTQHETREWLAAFATDPRCRVIDADVPFNWSALNNEAAREARGEVLVFLNNDTEVVATDWLERLVENAVRPEVGVCGPMLLYPDGTIQHAGVVVGMGGWADHVFKGLPAVHQQDLFASPILRRNVLAVTGACMVVERRKFEDMGGFDESFIVCGSDVELCLRAHARGLHNVFVAEARMIHHESKTRDPRAIPDSDFVRSAEAYGGFRTHGDPFYNPNLDPMSPVPALKAVQ